MDGLLKLLRGFSVDLKKRAYSAPHVGNWVRSIPTISNIWDKSCLLSQSVCIRIILLPRSAQAPTQVELRWLYSQLTQPPSHQAKRHDFGLKVGFWHAIYTFIAISFACSWIMSSGRRLGRCKPKNDTRWCRGWGGVGGWVGTVKVPKKGHNF